MITDQDANDLLSKCGLGRVNVTESKSHMALLGPLFISMHEKE